MPPSPVLIHTVGQNEWDYPYWQTDIPKKAFYNVKKKKEKKYCDRKINK